jgi:hypothetical protein
MNLKRVTTVGALVASIAYAGSASAATPHAGTYRAVAPQQDLRVDVLRHRVSNADLTFTLACDDGTSITRTADLGGAKISRRGRFTIAESSGGSHGPDGQIRLTLRLSGHFTSGRRAEGTFKAAAIVTESPITPAVACSSGVVAWNAER